MPSFHLELPEGSELESEQKLLQRAKSFQQKSISTFCAITYPKEHIKFGVKALKNISLTENHFCHAKIAGELQ